MVEICLDPAYYLPLFNMQKTIQFSLLLCAIILLTIFSFKIYKLSSQTIVQKTKLATMQDSEHLVQGNIDRLLENLSLGLHDNYSKRKEKISTLIDKTVVLQEQIQRWQSLTLIALVLFALLFYYLDKAILLIYFSSASLIALLFGVISPLLTLTVLTQLPFIGYVTLSYETKSIWGTITTLFSNHQLLLGLLLCIFSIGIPLLKTATLLYVGSLQELGASQKLLHLWEKIGKWSMADVFIVAVLVVFFTTKQDIQTVMTIESGLYFFVGYVMLSMIGSSVAMTLRK